MCRLTRQEVSELLDEDTRKWLIDPTALEGVSNDLGVIFNHTLKENSTATGGGLISHSSRDLIICQSHFQDNRASIHRGGAGIYEISSARIEEVTWSSNSAQLKRGGLPLENSDLESLTYHYIDNSTTTDRGFWILNGTATMTRDNVSENSAGGGGGWTAAQTATTIDFRDCVASQNIGFFGGGMRVSDEAATIRNMTYLAFPERGGGFACFQSNATILNSCFLSNTAYISGGALDAGICSVTARNLTIYGNTCERTGAGISPSGSSVFDVHGSTLQANSASDGGAFAAQSGTTVNLVECKIEANSTSSAAGERGGYRDGSVSSAFGTWNSSFTENRSEFGGCLYVNRFSAASFHDCLVADNTAVQDDAAFLEGAEHAANASVVKRNMAPLGVSTILGNSSLQLENSVFADHTAISSGGSIAANLKNVPTIVNTSFSNSSAETGGGIWLSNTTLTSYGVRFTEREAMESGGGGVLADFSSIFLCTTCTFSDNEVGKQEGGIAFDSAEPHSPALQLNNSTFNGNNVSLGGVIMVRKQTDLNGHLS